MMNMPPHMRPQPPPMGMPPPPGHFGVPPRRPPPTGYESHGHHNPQGMVGNMMAISSKHVESQKAALGRMHPQAYDNSNFNSLPPQPPAGMPKMMPQQSWEPPSNHGPMYSVDVS